MSDHPYEINLAAIYAKIPLTIGTPAHSRVDGSQRVFFKKTIYVSFASQAE